MTDDVAQSYLVSPAWLIGGLRNVPGYLGAGGGRLTFVSDTPVFDVPLDEVTDVTWPWYWFGGGVKLSAGGQRYKVTFVRPNGMPAPDPSMLESAIGVFGFLAGTWHDVSALRGLADIGTGRAAGKRWKEFLGA
ncbi:hypothetical protein [Modestobacter marinus]|uniref:hypothetical protein n=1 Tax=Modestobacter marinus TaxID=477641 RepID=UPI001C943D2D|nr:hypothetical protein [Modestobacter marinus]